MANYSRKDLEDQGNAEVGLGAGLLLATVVGIGKAISSSNSDKKRKERKDQLLIQINSIDRKINDLQSEFLGSWLNSDEIDRLQNERQELKQEYDNL